MSEREFSSNKPYLFRAILDWLLDNEATPYILVDATKKHVEVPQEHVKDGQIVLNINPSAVQNWQVDNYAIMFSARFSGVARQIYVPMNALMAVYAQENGLGMAFPAQEEEEELTAQHRKQQEQAELEETEEAALPEDLGSSKKGSHLKVIK